MASARSIRTGRVCQRLGHDFPVDYLVCRRCHRDLPSIKRGDSEVWRFKRPTRGPWSIRRFIERRKPKGAKQCSMCHDCAFRPGSPERIDVRVWEGVLQGVSSHRPFFCHEGMPVDARGHYAPQFDARGRPIGAKLCAGWLREHAHYHQPGNGLHHKSVLPSETEHEIPHPAVQR